MGFADTAQTLVQLSYLTAAFLFIVGLKRMSSPVTAVSGVRWAGVGMLLATLATLVFMGASTLNLALVIGAIAVGGAFAWVSGKRVAMTDMPQMIALSNGRGGGAAAAIAAVELYGGSEPSLTPTPITSTEAGRIVPAAVVSIGMNFSSSLAAISTAL